MAYIPWVGVGFVMVYLAVLIRKPACDRQTDWRSGGRTDGLGAVAKLRAVKISKYNNAMTYSARTV